MKKIIATTLIFLLSFTTLAYALPAPLDDAVKEELSKYGIITDFSIQSVNRAEAVKILLAAKGFNDVEQCDTVFSDVKKEYWASGYINTAYSYGIINGHGDGTFAPEEKLTNEQFIKMLVCMLGYDPMVHSPYPVGHMIVANTLGLTEGLALVGSDRAARSDVAVIMHNALATPIMVQTNFGTDISYSIMDGTKGLDYITFRTMLGDNSKKPVE